MENRRKWSLETEEKSKVRRKKSEERRPVMSREQSDGEGNGVENGTNRFVDVTAETEVELRLPLEVDMEPERIRKDVPIYPGVVDLDVVGPDPETQRRFGSANKGPNRSGPDTGFFKISVYYYFFFTRIYKNMNGEQQNYITFHRNKLNRWTPPSRPPLIWLTSKKPTPPTYLTVSLIVGWRYTGLGKEGSPHMIFVL